MDTVWTDCLKDHRLPDTVLSATSTFHQAKNQTPDMPSQSLSFWLFFPTRGVDSLCSTSGFHCEHSMFLRLFLYEVRPSCTHFFHSQSLGFLVESRTAFHQSGWGALLPHSWYLSPAWYIDLRQVNDGLSSRSCHKHCSGMRVLPPKGLGGEGVHLDSTLGIKDTYHMSITGVNNIKTWHQWDDVI